MSKTTGFAIVWRNAIAGGRVSVAHGKLGEMRSSAGGRVDGDQFQFNSDGAARLVGSIDDAHLDVGAFATRVSILDGSESGFTFFLRDVNSETPILLKDLGVAIIPREDSRDYAEIESAVRGKGLASVSQQIDAEPEESYESACRADRDLICPTWLGLGRDVRLFRVSPYVTGTGGMSTGFWGRVEPWNHSEVRDAPENREAIYYDFAIGRGSACSIEIKRWLEDGSLPILHSLQRDGEVEYALTFFATLETKPLSTDADIVRGTHYVAAFANTGGNMLTETEKALYDQTLRATEVRGREEEVVCWVRVAAVNRSGVPRYAYFRTTKSGESVSLLDGKPMPQTEVAVMIQPGASVTLDMLIPHRPIPRERLDKLARQNFAAHLDGCRSYWRHKLGSGASISVPEKAVDERIRAGLLHLDLNTLGLAQEGPLLACVGWYAPIGSESAPIIQFYDSMGWHKIAERCIQFFLDRQRDDGFIQTFGGYQLEPGPALWTVGEHYRYTRDEAWAKRIKDRVFKACDYVVAWRRRNQREELRGKGYGLLDGKVADPEDFFHSFMLNGLAYLGLKRIAEMYEDIDPIAAGPLARESDAFFKDLRAAYLQSIAASPVIPLGDGTWLPSFAPWAEYPGPVSLYAEGGAWNSHGAFACRDTLIGALYLVIGEVLDAKERSAEWLLRAHQELMTYRNAGFTQPYYCRHDFLHLKRGEVKQYLKTYYNQFAALQDRETYTFWEHYHGVSQHKTHEEAWFLMQTRWMLWHEDFNSSALHLLSMIPRQWMEDGKTIELENCASYFGRINVKTTSHVASGMIEASVTCEAGRAPKRVEIRLPHPQERRATKVIGGRYDSERETVVIEPFDRTADVTLMF